MRRLRFLVTTIALLAAALIAPLSARMGPSIMMVDGGTLRAPVFIRLQTVADLGTYANYMRLDTSPGREAPMIADGLGIALR